MGPGYDLDHKRDSRAYARFWDGADPCGKVNGGNDKDRPRMVLRRVPISRELRDETIEMIAERAVGELRAAKVLAKEGGNPPGLGRGSRKVTITRRAAGFRTILTDLPANIHDKLDGSVGRESPGGVVGSMCGEVGADRSRG